MMAVVISFLSYFLLGLVPSQVYASGTTGSLLFTHAWKKSYYLLRRGRTTLWKMQLPGFIHALPHTVFPYCSIKSYRAIAMQAINSNNQGLGKENITSILLTHHPYMTGKPSLLSSPHKLPHRQLPLPLMPAPANMTAYFPPFSDAAACSTKQLSMCNYEQHQIALYLIKTPEIILCHSYSV